MIKLQKTAIPTVLKENQAEWTKTIVDKASAGLVPTDVEKSRYRHADIKIALIEETAGKCAYCESKILHVGFGDVEHVSPKSKSINNLFRWDNLTLACDKCNTYKSDFEDIVDPYVDDPEEFFTFIGPLVVPNPGVEKGLLTEKTLKLNRPDLREKRTEKIKYLSDQLLIYKKTAGRLREVLRADLIKNEMSKDQEYTAVARSFLTIMLPKVGGEIFAAQD